MFRDRIKVRGPSPEIFTFEEYFKALLQNGRKINKIIFVGKQAAYVMNSFEQPLNQIKFT